jgi:hypothetical protein
LSPLTEPETSAFGLPYVRFMIVRHERSTLENFLDSSGSWRLMSSAEKMDSRYIHAFWQLSHSSSVSETASSFFWYDSTSGRMGAQ